MIPSTKDAAFGQAPMTGVCQMLHQGAVCQMHDHGICVDLLGLTGWPIPPWWPKLPDVDDEAYRTRETDVDM